MDELVKRESREELERKNDWQAGEIKSYLAIIADLQAELEEWKRTVEGETKLSSDRLQTICQLQASLDEARRENAVLRKDAERYRWLRSRLWIRMMRSIAGSLRPALGTIPGRSFMDSTTVAPNEKRASELDAAIDAARQDGP